ncbi:ABC transporter permease [Devosia sp.]|uniref:ABC transporter permease n=1 Tax=Devosia sp. TaxID=1871048 RepID=UPI002AFE1567|nr:ABC transporter permease [Devosia sp.]
MSPGMDMTGPAEPHRAVNWSLWVALGVFGLIAAIAVLAPLVLPYSSAAGSLLDRLKPPGTLLRDGTLALLGTDALGRDVLTLAVHGFRTSVLVATLATLCSCLVGTALGVTAGYLGGWTDAAISRAIDIVLVFPAILLAIVIAGLLGPSLVNLVIVLVATRWVVFARIGRASTLSLREREWVRGAFVLGVARPLIIIRHVLPFLAGPLATVATLEFAAFVMTEASLSFLGIGLPASTLSLGKTISEGREHIGQAYWISTYPGLLLVLLVVSIGLVGDNLSERFVSRRERQ